MDTMMDSLTKEHQGNLSMAKSEIMTNSRYCDILANKLLLSFRKLKIKNFAFEQHNNPKHTSNSTKECFQKMQIKVLEELIYRLVLVNSNQWKKLKKGCAQDAARQLKGLKRSRIGLFLYL